MIVNKTQFAEIIGKSERWVTTLQQEGMPVESARKKGVAVKIDTTVALAWLIDREVAKATGGGTGSREQEELRLIAWRANKTEVETRLLRGELASLDEMRAAVAAAMTVMATTLDGLGGRLAGQLATMDSPAEIRDLLLDECRRIRLAAHERLANFGVDPDSGTNTQAAAEADRLEVGGE